MADIPTVIFDTRQTVTQPGKTDRVQVTGNGFVKGYLTRLIGFLNDSVAPARFIRSGKDTVFIIHDRGHFLPAFLRVFVYLYYTAAAAALP